MRVQHNIMAMSAYRNYTNNVSAMQKNLEKLSSGYKINRAGDDAAGLAISEKMRAQITGLETAQKNAKDGISLVQTAEGALTEVHDMLNRMVELATQSANGTYADDTDRTQLQKEVEKLKEEINRIADSANFNGIQLLDGSYDGEAKVIAGDKEAKTFDVTSIVDGAQGGGSAVTGAYEFDLAGLEFTNVSTGANMASWAVTITVKIGSDTFNISGTVALTSGSHTITMGDLGGWTIEGASATTFAVDGVTYSITVNGNKIEIKGEAAPNGNDSILQNATITGVTTEKGLGTDTGGWDTAVHPTSIADYAGAKKYGKASFELSADMVVDGAKLTIGTVTYVFKVGSKSTVNDPNAIDLSEYEADDANLVYFAAMKLANAGNQNDLFDISTGDNLRQGGDSYTIYLREKEYDASSSPVVDYGEDWDLSKGSDGWNTGVAGGNYEGRGVVMFQTVDQQREEDESKALTLQIGDTAADYNQIKVYIGSVKTKDLGINGIDISDRKTAADAIDVIKDAINQVSDIRGTLGATQNRLDHTINNLSVMTENIQDAESTIRDTDVAEEMMAYTKNNILIQAAQAMLAQANQVPQGVLQLLQ